MTTTQLQTKAQSKAQSKAKPKRSPWPYAIVIVFGVQACVLTTTMVMAARMPANAEPGYYDKALAWNDRAAALAIPRQEGWQTVATAHNSLVTLSLADAQMAPITGATVSAQVFHRAAALDRHSLNFVETAPGIYRAPIPSRSTGLWDLRFEINAQGHDPAALTKTVEVR